MGRSFNFLPFQRPVAPTPIESFSSTMGLKLEQFKEGEAISNEAKELFGLLPVAKEDQDQRNKFAQELSDDLDGLLEEYNGAYESTQFQRDARKIIATAAANPALLGWTGTMEEQKFEDELRRQAKISKETVYDFNPGGFRGTSYNPETGYSSYKTGLEYAQNHLADAEAHIGKLTANSGTYDPKLDTLEGGTLGNLFMLAQGDWTGIGSGRTKTRAQEVVEDFARSANGGLQMARKFALDNEIEDLYDENGQLDFRIATSLSDYLYRVAKKQEFSRSNMNYSLPAAANRAPEESRFSQFGPQAINVDLTNIALANKLVPLKEEDFTGKGLQGASKKRMDELALKGGLTYDPLGNIVGAEDPNALTDAETKELRSLVTSNLKLQDVDGITSYITSFRKSDGSFDLESLEDTNRGLYRAYKSLLDDLEINVEEVMSGDINPELLNPIDGRVVKRYNDTVSKSMVAVGAGYAATEKYENYFNRTLVGKSKAGLGRLTNIGFVDESTGNELTVYDIAEENGVNLDNAKEAMAFKDKMNLELMLVPILGGNFAKINIGGKGYQLKDDRTLKAIQNAKLGLATSVILGENEVSEQTDLPFLLNKATGRPYVGRFEANHSWDSETDRYNGNGIIFRTGENEGFPLKFIIESYLYSEYRSNLLELEE